jgi:hypothetical protein
LVNINTNKQIKNQNKETYRPRLKLNNIEVVEHDLDKYYLYAYSKHYNEESDSITLYVDIILENIGNGYFYFVYPSGGLFIVEQKAIRSLKCIREV